MSLEEILAELEYNNEEFPQSALKRAIEEREAITPYLLASLEEAKNKAEELLEEPDYFLHIYSLFLLAQFREAKAYILIVEFFSLPEEISLDLTGDIVTEYLNRILASVCHGELEPIKKLIETLEINEFVRSAALGSLIVLVAQGILSREEVIDYYQELFQTKLERENSYIWTALVIESLHLCPIELKEDIQQVFADDLIESFMIDFEEVEESLDQGLETALERLHTEKRFKFIDDTMAEMEWWDCFQEEKEPIFIFQGDNSIKNKAKSQAKKKRKAQKEARRKNRKKK